MNSCSKFALQVILHCLLWVLSFYGYTQAVMSAMPRNVLSAVSMLSLPRSRNFGLSHIFILPFSHATIKNCNLTYNSINVSNLSWLKLIVCPKLKITTFLTDAIYVFLLRASLDPDLGQIWNLDPDIWNPNNLTQWNLKTNPDTRHPYSN
jgi:hypothetical protein